LTPRVLHTEGGTPIRRWRGLVGKDIGGLIYLHRRYARSLPDQDLLARARARLAEVAPFFDYNVIKLAAREGNVTFFHSPDFDVADEPTAGDYVVIRGDGTFKIGHTNAIWHHRWLWVQDDYPGFDVGQSFERSRRWLALSGIDFARIGQRQFWERTVLSRLKTR